MPTLYDTIRTWREAQTILGRQDAARRAAQQGIIDRMVGRLQRHRSLADLASGYYRDGEWWLPVVREFSVDVHDLDGELLRDAAYFQRLLQLRRPGGR